MRMDLGGNGERHVGLVDSLNYWFELMWTFDGRRQITDSGYA